jgi:type IV pilus assembly protein PilM
VDKILITGGGAITPGFQEYIQQNVGVETLIANPFINLEGDVIKKIPKPEASSITTAIGLALKK